MRPRSQLALALTSSGTSLTSTSTPSLQPQVSTTQVGTHSARSSPAHKRSASTALAGTHSATGADPRAGRGPFPKPRPVALPTVSFGQTKPAGLGHIHNADSDLMREDQAAKLVLTSSTHDVSTCRRRALIVCVGPRCIWLKSVLRLLFPSKTAKMSAMTARMSATLGAAVCPTGYGSFFYTDVDRGGHPRGRSFDAAQTTLGRKPWHTLKFLFSGFQRENAVCCFHLAWCPSCRRLCWSSTKQQKRACGTSQVSSVLVISVLHRHGVDWRGNLVLRSGTSLLRRGVPQTRHALPAPQEEVVMHREPLPRVVRGAPCLQSDHPRCHCW